jgi:glycerol-1-phosphate dehydrogenase [NAD(P)+]
VPHTRVERALAKATDTRAVIVEAGALRGVEAAMRTYFTSPRALIVADENTYRAAGRQIHLHLESAAQLADEPLVFPGAPRLHPEFEHVLRIEAYLKAQDATPVAVGSGVINDLVKLAAHRLGRPYLCVATAASMDGYTAFAAAITHNGIKRVDPCAAPRVVLADVDVLAAAPPAMAASGYGDLLGKVIAGADWMIAGALGIETIDPTAWEHSQHGLREWTGDPQALRRRVPKAFSLLIEGLLMAGLSMQAARSSRPASGSEHLFSHLWEMEGLRHGANEPSHGFKVGLGTVASAALAERLVMRDLTTLDPAALQAAWPAWDRVEAAVRGSFAEGHVAASAAEESRAKYLTRQELRGRIETIRRAWPELQRALWSQLSPVEELRVMLASAGCPTTPEELGMTRAQLQRDYARARQIRSRYTLLDLAAEAGLLDSLVGSLFARDGFWGRVG